MTLLMLSSMYFVVGLYTLKNRVIPFKDTPNNWIALNQGLKWVKNKATAFDSQLFD